MSEIIAGLQAVLAVQTARIDELERCTCAEEIPADDDDGEVRQPVFAQPQGYLARVSEDAAVGTAIVTVHADDGNATILYAIQEADGPPGLFSIDQSSGVIHLTRSTIDRARYPEYVLLIAATSNRPGTPSSHVEVVVGVDPAASPETTEASTPLLPSFQPEAAPEAARPYYRLDYLRNTSARLGPGRNFSEISSSAACSGDPAHITSIRIHAGGCTRSPEHRHASLQYCDSHGIYREYHWDFADGTPDHLVVCGDISSHDGATFSVTSYCEACCGDDHPDADPEHREYRCALPAAIEVATGFDLTIASFVPGGNHAGCEATPIELTMSKTDTCIDRSDRETGTGSSILATCSPLSFRQYGASGCPAESISIDYTAMLNLTAADLGRCLAGLSTNDGNDMVVNCDAGMTVSQILNGWAPDTSSAGPSVTTAMDVTVVHSGDLLVQHNSDPAVLDVGYFSTITEVTGRLSVYLLRTATSIGEAFQDLGVVGSSLTVFRNDALASFGRGFRALVQVGGYIHIERNPLLASFGAAFQSMVSVGSWLRIHSNTRVVSLDTAFQSLATVGGVLAVYSNPYLSTLGSAFRHLNHVGLSVFGGVNSSITISGNPRLTSLGTAFEELVSLPSALVISDNGMLSSFGTAFQWLRTLSGNLKIYNNFRLNDPLLADWDNFQNLTCHAGVYQNDASMWCQGCPDWLINLPTC